MKFFSFDFFSFDRPLSQWGDYGDILHHGMSSRDEQSGLQRLERTGPFSPPIFSPGMRVIIVDDSFRSALENSNLTGFTFRPVIKHHIVDLDWSDWKGGEPDFYPESGEPEDYILEALHSPDVANKMPEFWELVIEETAHVLRTKDASAKYGVVLSLLIETWNGDDFFRAPEVGHTFVTEKAKLFLAKEVAEFVRFREW